jgi:predicted GNAT family acetyltransferase
VPFLHHSPDNHPARRVYEALGFEFRREISIAVVGAP